MNISPKFFQSLLVIILLATTVIMHGDTKDLQNVVREYSKYIEELTPQSTKEVKGQKDGLFEVVRVVDGDTITIRDGQGKETVRLLGINTPETVDPRRPVECFGQEAKKYLTDLLHGKLVRLENDSSQQDRDKYQRLLRYIFLEDGTSVNETLVRRGYAYEYTYDLPYKYQSLFRAAQQEAEKNKRGLWSDQTCSGKK